MTVKCWIICRCDRWAEQHCRSLDEFIPLPDRPSYVHYSQEHAEDEILRLQKAHPECSYVLFESASYTQGKAWQEGYIYTLERCHA